MKTIIKKLTKIVLMGLLIFVSKANLFAVELDLVQKARLPILLGTTSTTEPEKPELIRSIIQELGETTEAIDSLRETEIITQSEANEVLHGTESASLALATLLMLQEESSNEKEKNYNREIHSSDESFIEKDANLAAFLQQEEWTAQEENIEATETQKLQNEEADLALARRLQRAEEEAVRIREEATAITTLNFNFTGTPQFEGESLEEALEASAAAITEKHDALAKARKQQAKEQVQNMVKAIKSGQCEICADEEEKELIILPCTDKICNECFLKLEKNECPFCRTPF